jgi:uncharacterized membrane protein
MKKYWLYSLLALAAVACTDDDNEVEDTVKPQINKVTINEADHDIQVTAGTEMHIDADLSDNEELRELKIDIHDVFDGHEHGKRAEWEEVILVDLSGKTQTLHKDVDVPASATAGAYHAVFRVLDLEGNEGDFVELNFTLVNGNEPQFAISSPDFSDHLDYAPGETIAMVGTVTDDVDLEEVKIEIYEEGHDHSHKKSEGPLFEQDFDLDGSADTSFDLSNFTIVIPADAEFGHYEIELKALDSDGNYGIVKGELHLD